jgi:hypothetical protein
MGHREVQDAFVEPSISGLHECIEAFTSFGLNRGVLVRKTRSNVPRFEAAPALPTGTTAAATGEKGLNENAPVPAGYEAGTRGALEGGEVLRFAY